MLFHVECEHQLAPRTAINCSRHVTVVKTGEVDDKNDQQDGALYTDRCLVDGVKSASRPLPLSAERQDAIFELLISRHSIYIGPMWSSLRVTRQ